MTIELRYNIGIKIGSGVDGDVYEYPDNKIIKIYKENKFSLSPPFKETEKVLNFLKLYSCPAYVRVYDYGFVENNTNFHYYITDRLNNITEDEWKVFHSILSHEDRNIIKNFSELEIKKMLEGMSRGLDFDDKRIIFFISALKRSQIKHLDLHPRNILKDNAGYFKLVDFNRTIMENNNGKT